MAQEKDASQDSVKAEASQKSRKGQQLNALIFAAVIILGIVLPPRFKGFAPFLFVIPIIWSVMNKIHRIGEDPANPPKTESHSPAVPHSTTGDEPYSYQPKDPKDPRKYKPIG